MALPVIDTPKYSAKIPSTGKTVAYRPYLVKEEKILMIALESENQDQVLTAVKDIIYACTYEKVDVDDLAAFDLEYLFLNPNNSLQITLSHLAIIQFQEQ